jgi:hypothetical protein
MKCSSRFLVGCVHLHFVITNGYNNKGPATPGLVVTNDHGPFLFYGLLLF